MTKYFTQSILEKEIIINEKASPILLLNRQQVYRDATNNVGHLNLTGHVPRLSKGKVFFIQSLKIPCNNIMISAQSFAMTHYQTVPIDHKMLYVILIGKYCKLCCTVNCS